MISSNIFVLGIFLFFLFPVPYVFSLSSNDDISIIRQRILELTIWPLPENVSSTVQAALNFSSTLNSSCYWPDVNYTDQTVKGPWDTEKHIMRVTTMIQAVTVNGSSVKNDSKLLSNAHCALNVWLINDWKNPNWWFNEIGIPLEVTSQLLMLGDNVTSFEIEKIKEISFRAAWWIPSPFHVGANLVWQIQIEIYRSLATKNLTGIEQGFSRMWQDVTFANTTVAGVQNDWAYHFHAYQILSGSYGLLWANDILLFLQCSLNTPYQPKYETLLFFADFLIKGDTWQIMGNEWDWHVRGRGISSPNQLASHGFTTSWIRSLAQLIQLKETKVELINFADRLDNVPHTPQPIGNKHFFMSDYLVHRRANWTASIKIQSMRTIPAECILGQNIKDEHGGQGVLNIYRSGTNDYFNIFPILDWQAINGITVEHGVPLHLCDFGHFDIIRLYNVGGVSDGQYGLVYMDTANHNLTAQRSWYFYDDAIIALATNITLRTQTTAWTTLASRLLPTGQITIAFFNSTIHTLMDGNYSFPYIQNKTSNVQWIHLGGSDIGYLLQLQQQYDSLVVQVGIKTGDFNSIGPASFLVTERMLTLAINHGVGPYTLDYNYIILPNVSLESMPRVIKQYNEEQVFGCISTNNLFHGTMWPSLKRASFVLWDDNVTTFSCKSPLFEINIQLKHSGAYLFSETNKDFTLTVSHYKRWNVTVNAIVDRVGHGEGCSISSYIDATATNMTVMLPPTRAWLGASVNVTCKK
jgi:chondroitin AC lyase